MVEMLPGVCRVSEPLFTGEETDTASDLMLAQMLQMEFDREFDTQLRREEKKFNGDSKGEAGNTLRFHN